MSIWTLDSINLTNIWYYPVCSLRLPKQMAVGPFERDRGIITMRVCIVLQEPFSWGHSEFFSQLVWAWQLAQVQKLGKWLQLFLLSTSWSSIFDFFFFDCTDWAVPFLVAHISCPCGHHILLITSIALCGSDPTGWHSNLAAVFTLMVIFYYLTSIIWGVLSSHLLSSGLKSLTISSDQKKTATTQFLSDAGVSQAVHFLLLW